MDELSSGLAPRVLAVVVSHNGRRWLLSCLEALLRQDYPSLDVVVIDNGSEVPVATAVGEVIPGAEVLRLDRNVGFGAAANLALESSAKAPGAAYFLFIHDDVALQRDCVTQLVAAAQATEAGVVGGKGVSWDDPNVLLEVGMTADQLCYPFSGLEEGEIDQGQHDARREVLFVTSACCLLSRALVERCGSWDGGYFLFGEDLDLCLRGRMAGFKVVVEPSARFLHVAGLSSGVRELRRRHTARFYTRRNRLRTIAKTAATYRMWAVLLVYVVLAIGEMVALAAMRRFEEIPAYPRAIGSFLLSLPDIVRRRRAVQKRRTLPDRRIRRFMVRDLHRLRVFAERRLRDLELGTLRFGAEAFSRLSPARLRPALARSLRRPTTLVGIVLTVLMLFAMRDLFFGDPLAVGGIWPFPEPTRRLLSDYVSGWREVGLGTSAPTPPALPVLWVSAAVALGGIRTAQSVLLLGLLLTGFVGVYRLVARRTDTRWARLLAMAVYGLGPVTEAITGTVDLGALALFAGAPFMLEIGLRMLRPTPGEAGDRPAIPLIADLMSQNAVRLSIVTALVVALGPSNLIAVLGLWLVTGVLILGAAWDRREAFRRVGWIFAAVIGALILLLPWSIDALRPEGAILGPLTSGLGGGPTYQRLWSESGFERLLFLGPGEFPSALVAPSLSLSVLLLAGAARRREARLLAGVWLCFALFGGFASAGWIPAPVASPAAWMVIPLAAMAALAGHLVAGVREELPRHTLGWRHVATAIVSLTVGAGMIAGWGPQLGGWEVSEATLAAPTGRLGRSISSFFIAKSEQDGDFRILWFGNRWVDPIRNAVRRMGATPYLLTRPTGLSISDLYDPSPRQGERRLDDIMGSLSQGRLHHAGHLLAPASVRYIVASTDDHESMSAMRRQNDFALEHQQSGIAVFRNLNWLPRASFVPAGLVDTTNGKADDKSLMLAQWEGGRPIPKRTSIHFGDELPRTYQPLILFADNFDTGWRARVGDETLDHERAFGWTNRFEVPEDAKGRLQLVFSRRWLRVLLVLAQGSMLALAVAMARLRSREIRGALL